MVYSHCGGRDDVPFPRLTPRRTINLTNLLTLQERRLFEGVQDLLLRVLARKRESPGACVCIYHPVSSNSGSGRKKANESKEWSKKNAKSTCFLGDVQHKGGRSRRLG